MRNSIRKEIKIEIKSLLSLMRHQGKHTPEYAESIDRLKILLGLLEVKDVLPILQTVLMLLGNTVWILLIINEERVGTIMSKAMNFLWKKGRG